MKTLGNILWHFPFFGFVTAIVVYLFGILLTITVIAAPIGLGLMELGKFLFWPFGNAMVSKTELSIEQNKGWKLYSGIVRIVYFPFGLIFCVMSAIQVALLFISIIGIPAALVIAKCLSTYFNPVNKKCVPSAVKNEIERRQAVKYVDKYLNKNDNSQSNPPSSPINTVNDIPIKPVTETQQAYNRFENVKDTVKHVNIDEISNKTSESLKTSAEWIQKNKKGLGVLLLSAIVIYTTYSLFFKPNPEKDGKAVAEAFCKCTEEKTEKTAEVYSTFIEKFDPKNYRKREEARNDLNAKINNLSIVTSVCDKKAKELLMEMTDKYADNFELNNRFQSANTRYSGICAVDWSKVQALSVDFENKIKAITEPLPDMDRLRVDLIGKSILGWTCNNMSDMNDIQIINKYNANSRAEYRLNVKYNTQGNQIPVQSDVLMTYIMNDQGWSFSNIKCYSISYLNVVDLNNWTSIRPLNNCKYSFNTNDKKIWVKDGYWGREMAAGPNINLNLTQSEIYMRSGETTPVNVTFTYFPN
jgi:uncharacterized membrane protein YccF (DUF307 family)